jgi:hypothetical protein
MWFTLTLGVPGQGHAVMFAYLSAPVLVVRAAELTESPDVDDDESGPTENAW